MSISGLTVLHNFITTDYEDYLIKNIKKEKWNSDLSRRTQHYSAKIPTATLSADKDYILWKYNYVTGNFKGCTFCLEYGADLAKERNDRSKKFEKIRISYTKKTVFRRFSRFFHRKRFYCFIPV